MLPFEILSGIFYLLFLNPDNVLESLARRFVVAEAFEPFLRTFVAKALVLMPALFACLEKDPFFLMALCIHFFAMTLKFYQSYGFLDIGDQLFLNSSE